MTNIDYALIYINYLLEKIYKGISPVHVVKRRSKTGVIARISPEVQSGIYDIDHIKHLGEYSELVAEFKTTFDEKLSHCNNTALYDRLESIQIVNIQVEDDKVNGRYNEKTNRVLMYTTQINKHKNPNSRRRNVLFHEVIHMATSYTRGIISMVGFSQKIANKYSKGNGLNEGYTELINQRYFARTVADGSPVKISYPREQVLAYGIEMLVGREKMEELFFNADLDGLIAEMSKYMPTQEANILINIFDLYEKKKSDTDMIDASAKAMLANRIIQKNMNLYQQGIISKEEYEFKLLEVEMFTRGYSLTKQEDDYCLEPIFVEDKKTISSEGYRVFQNYFKQTKGYGELYDEQRILDYKDSKFVSTYLTVATAEERDKMDFSQVETIEVIDHVSKQYKTTPRKNSSDLSGMLEELDTKPPETDTKDSSKK